MTPAHAPTRTVDSVIGKTNSLKVVDPGERMRYSPGGGLERSSPLPRCHKKSANMVAITYPEPCHAPFIRRRYSHHDTA